MFALFIVLLLSNRFLGQRNTSKIVKWLDIPCGFCLRWLNLLFTPSFVTLPLSPRISFNEVLKIAAVFGTNSNIVTDISVWFSHRNGYYGMERARIDTYPGPFKDEPGEPTGRCCAGREFASQ